MAGIQTSLAPWLSVQSTKKAVAFYKEAFSAVETYRLEDNEGKAVVKLSINGAEFWLGDSGNSNNVPENIGGGTVRMVLTVDDPDAFFIKAINAGATEIFPVCEEYGWLLGRCVDPFGLHWEIGKPLHK